MSFLTVPPPLDDDHEDVAWALRAASAQWKREAHQDAIHWVQRASETAQEIGASGRAQELKILAKALSNASMPVASVPPPPPAMAPPPPPGSLPNRAPAVSLIDIDVDDVDFDDDIEELDDDDDIELIDEDGIEELDAVEEVEEVYDATPEPVSAQADSSDSITSRPPASARSYQPIAPPSLPPLPSAPSDSYTEDNEATIRDSVRSHRSVSSRPPSSRSVAPRSETSRSEAPRSEAPPSETSASGETSRPSSRPSSSRASRPSSKRPSRSKRPSARNTSSRPSASSKSPKRSTTGSRRYSSAPPSASSDPDVSGSSPRKSRPGRTTTSPKLDRLPPSMRPEPSGLDLDEAAEDELIYEEGEAPYSDEYGELYFGDEAKTRRRESGAPPPIPDLGPITMDGSTIVPIEDQTAAEYAQTQAEIEHDHEALERELGVDLSVRNGRRPASARPPRSPVPSSAPSYRPSKYPSSVPPGVIGGAADALNDSQIPELDISARSPVPGRASARPSQRSISSAPRMTSSSFEPYGLAPSASMPPVGTTADAPPIEPPSSPTQAPPPSSMAEPEHSSSSLPPPPSEQLDYSDIPPASAAPDPDEFEELFSKISVPPVAPSTVAPAPELDAPSFDTAAEDSSQARRSIPASPSVGEDGSVLVDGLDLMEVPGFQDLPEDSALALAQRAELRTLSQSEEISGFGLAIVTHGAVTLMPSVADAVCRTARRGEVLFTEGTLEESATVRVVGLEEGSRVAVFSKDDLERAVSSCPWVGDELAVVADTHLAFAGAVLGALGDSLDEMFRFMVLDKCTVKRRDAGELIAQGGKAMDGMYILGGGRLEELDENGAVVSEFSMGDFVFPETVLSAGPAQNTVRVGPGGALVLYAPRMAAHELLATCPPFIELLAR